MTDKIKLDIISDVVCPWCIIGYKRLAKAISEMGIQDKITIEWQPFELNPNMPSEGEDVTAHLAKKYGMTVDDSRQALAQMTAHGAELGFTFDFFDGFKMVNTRNLHIALDYAKKSGKQTELKMRLFKAFFSEKKDVSDQQILAQELQHVGIDASEVLARVNNDTARNHIQDREAYWRDLGVTAVPTMVFNNASSLVGAQPVDTYKQVLTELLEQQQQITS